MIRTRCICCGSGELEEIINLGSHAMADSFIEHSNFDKADGAYPLITDRCLKCHHSQLRITITEDERYSSVPYSYTSANSEFSRTHWQLYAQDVGNITLMNGFAAPYNILDIGSNDGYLLHQFKTQYSTATVVGIDASRHMCNIARETYNIEHIQNGVFGKDTVADDRKFDLIVANNVLNHSNNPIQFVRDVASLLDTNGSFVFEFPYWGETVSTVKFDQIYHEHVSYFTVHSICTLLRLAGLRAYRIEFVNYHGGSIRVFAKVTDTEGDTVLSALAMEKHVGLLERPIYTDFRRRVENTRTNFMRRLYDNISSDAPIYCVGAAAKANTFLTYYGLNSTIVRAITDASPHKQGKYTPLTRIPIVSDSNLALEPTPQIIITSWNLEHILKPVILRYAPLATFLNLI